ncbi:helix-turn-helix domain-containing protein [Serinicoccus kebangsaanensis]|uniref:helix-turn-helix domain-containing protein n=1 Tax=Serinicoccus kebangsaanensis TaxID=2602069 RepID=UPI00178C6A0A|nr:helix-turn-helix domain-containing protein [Serinicoccus kebangsaanensis]
MAPQTATSPPQLAELELDRHTGAALAGVSLRTFDRFVSAGQLPAYKVGGRTRFRRREDVEALVRPVARDVDPIDEHVAALVDAAPVLTPAQRDRLAAIFASGAKAVQST